MTTDVPAAIDPEENSEPVEAVDPEFFGSEDDEEVDELPPRHHRVTAVIVTHDGARWLPAALTALSRSTRRPDRVVAVDTGSTDTTVEILGRAEKAGLIDRVVTLPRESGFGVAVAAALATSSGVVDELAPDTVRWAWLLHDDSAPSATALEKLLRHADRTRSADIVGP